MAKNFLLLNEEKTEVIVFGQPKDSAKSLLDLNPLASYFKTLVRDLGFQIYNKKMEKQIHSVVRACFYNLHLLAKTEFFLSNANFESVNVRTHRDEFRAWYSATFNTSWLNKGRQCECAHRREKRLA